MSKTTPSSNFDPEARYVTSYLFSATALGFIRLSLGTYIFVVGFINFVLTSIETGLPASYFSYFTHLSNIGLTAWLLTSGAQSLVFAKSARLGNHARYPLQSWPRVMSYLHEFLFATIATFPLLVTTVYWALLAGSDSFSDTYNAWLNISQHILNSVFTLFELMFTNLPSLKLIQLAGTLLILALYLGLAYSAQIFQGFYPYDFLDPKDNPHLVAYILGIFGAQMLISVAVYFSILIRTSLVGNRQYAPLQDTRYDEIFLEHTGYNPGG